MTTHTETPDLLTLAEVAQRLRVSRTTMHRIINERGQLPTVRIDARVLVPRAALEEFISQAKSG